MELMKRQAWKYKGLDDIQTGNNVVFPSCPFQLSEEEITILNEIDVFAHDGNTGTNIYL